MDISDDDHPCGLAASTASRDTAESLRVGGWTLVPDLLSLRYDRWLLTDGRLMLPLTRAERAIIACLFASPDRRATRDALIQAILGTWQFPCSRRRRATANLTVTIGRLRGRARRAGIRIVCVREPDAYRWES